MKVNIGCGHKKIYGFVNVDIDETCKPDLVDNIYLDSFKENSVSLIYACHVLEHTARKELFGVLISWFRVLENGGNLYISVPDFDAVCKHYIFYGNLELVKGLLWGGQKNSFDFHKNGFDYTYLTDSLKKTGFTDISKYDHDQTEWKYVDDYSQAYLPHLDKTSGKLMSLNIRCKKCMI